MPHFKIRISESLLLFQCFKRYELLVSFKLSHLLSYTLTLVACSKIAFFVRMALYPSVCCVVNMVEQNMTSDVIWSNPMLKEGLCSQTRLPRAISRRAFDVSKNRDHLSGWPSPGFSFPHWEMAFFHCRIVLPVTFLPCFASFHCASLKRVWICLLYDDPRGREQ